VIASARCCCDRRPSAWRALRNRVLPASPAAIALPYLRISVVLLGTAL
jgi:hypothetical protein